MKQEIAQIRAAFDQEDNKIPVEVESSLKKIEKSYDDLQVQITNASDKNAKQVEDYGELYKESKKRQTRVKELELELETEKDAKDKILKDTKHEDYDELVKYKSDNEALLAEGKEKTRKQFIKVHEEIKEHDDYEKAKDNFKLPEDKDGKLDWTEISDDDMVLNMQKLTEQQGYGLFGGQSETLSVNTEGAGRSGGKGTDEFSVLDKN